MAKKQGIAGGAAVNKLRLHDTAFFSLVLIEETRPPFCTVVHFVYILMDPAPT
jgi:hypothetical protein